MATGSTSTGFLDAIGGAKFTAWLKEVSRPECDGDDRAPAARRVDAFDRLLDDTAQTGTTQTGAPAGESTETTESMRRPRRAETRLLVLADLETLLRLPGAAQATLAGFGHIGTDLLGSLTCAAGAEATTRSAMAHGTPSGSGLARRRTDLRIHPPART